MRLAVLLLLLSTLPGDSAFPVHVLNVKGDHIVLRPYTAPLLVLQLKSGTTTEKSVASCKQEIVAKDYADHGDTEVEFICGGAVLELKGIYFGE